MADGRVATGMARQLAERRALLSAGARHLGWKAGFASKAAMDRFGTRSPLFGFLTDQSLLASGATVSIAGWMRAVFEPEIAVHFGSNLKAGAGEAAVRKAISGLGPAIELADVDPDVVDVERILAGDIFHRYVVLGPVDRGRAGGSAADIETRVFRDGEEVARATDPMANPGEMIWILQELAATLEASGEALRAGDVVIAGSLVPPIQVAPGQMLRARIGALGEVEVRFEEVTA